LEVTNNIILEVKYTKSHEWIESLEGNKYRIGITNHAQSQLGEIVHIEHPAVGKNFDAGTGVVTIESVKTTADVYTPSKGKLVQLNKHVI
jgi:glycine cleavage system H protein